MKKYVRDGKVAVLVSRGYGAGWYSWNKDFEQLLYDPVIVDMLLRGVDECDIIQYADSEYPEVYTGGIDGLEVVWVDEGMQFRIEEYDGAERIEFCDEVKWHTA